MSGVAEGTQLSDSGVPGATHSLQLIQGPAMIPALQRAGGALPQIIFSGCPNLPEKRFWSGKAVMETLASVFCTVRDTFNELINLQ